MDELIKRLYALAESDTVNDDDLITVLGLTWDGEHDLKPDGVVNLAASIEEYGHHAS